MLNAIYRSRLSQFWRCRKGNVAMMFGLSLMPMAVAAGAGVDVARTMTARTQIANALDAAGLAIGTTTGMTNAQITDMARQYFRANYTGDATYGTPAPVTVTQSGQDFVLATNLSVPTTLMKLVGIDDLPLAVEITVTRSSMDLEVALALDTTGSMAGQKIADLKVAAKDLIDLVVQDNQTLNYSKIALVPYSMGVNLGTYVNGVRGTPRVASTNITAAAWSTGTAKTITGATKTNPIEITSSGHGFVTGDRIYITGVGGMTQLNKREYTVTYVSPSKYKLTGIDGTTSMYSNYTSGGSAIKCITASCEIQVTSAGHASNNDEWVLISGVSGLAVASGAPSGTVAVGSGSSSSSYWVVSNRSTNTFVLKDSDGPNLTAYSSGGTAACRGDGCVKQRFLNMDGAYKEFSLSNCVTERTGANAYTDAAPSTALFGRNYPASGNPCIGQAITPLSADRLALKDKVDLISAGGSTGGHIGVGWTWYMLAPNFGYLWPAASQPAVYGRERLMKVAIIMTDGEYNSMYCKGVISQDATSGSGSSSDHINCNAPNGHAFDQATAQCSAMKAAGVIVYTVGFQVVSDPRAQALVNNCATDAEHVYLPATGAELKSSFRAIGQEITKLRLAR